MKGPLGLSLAAAAVLLVAGCSQPATTNSPAVATSVSIAPTPTPSPSSTPTVPTVEQAYLSYLRLVDPSNNAAEAYNKAIHQHKPWRTLRAYERRLTTTIAQEAKAVQATRWPERVQPAVNKWHAALIADDALLNRAAKATSEADFFAAAHKALGKQSHAAEEKVLQALGATD